MNPMKPRLHNAAPRRDGGFTAIEALIVVAILAVVMLVAYTTFQGSQKVGRTASVMGDAQQSGRIALDLITSDLRMLGYGVETDAGQIGLVHAGPWDLAFNANVLPQSDDFLNPGNLQYDYSSQHPHAVSRIQEVVNDSQTSLRHRPGYH